MPHRPRIYVAAASAELPRAEAAVRELRTIGVEVIGDWTEDVLRWGAEGLHQSNEERAERSAEQLRHVLRADALLVLVPFEGRRTRGAWMEAGTAYAADIPVVASCASPRLPWVIAWAEHAPTDAVAISRVVRAGRSAPRHVLYSAERGARIVPLKRPYRPGPRQAHPVDARDQLLDDEGAGEA